MAASPELTKSASRWEPLALCLGYGLGNAGATSQAVWVAAAIGTHLTSTPNIGLLASAELLLIAAAALSGALWVHRVAPRRAVPAAASLIVVGNLVAMLPSLPMVVSGRLLSGLSMGALLAVITAVATGRNDAQRVLTFMQGSVLVIAVAIFAMAPFLTTYGPAGVFAVLAALAGVTGLVAYNGLSGGQSRAAKETPVAPRATMLPTGLRLGPIICCAGLAIASAGTATIGTYFLVIGERLGFDAAVTAGLLAIALPMSLIGPVAAHFLGERIGLMFPLIGALALAAADILLIVHAPSVLVFGASLAFLCALIMFYPPYALAVAGRLDPSGRVAGASVAFMMVGSALGPRLGSEFIDSSDLTAMGVTAGSLVLIGACLLMTASALGRRTPALQPT